MKRIDDHLHMLFDGITLPAFANGMTMSDAAHMKVWMDTHDVVHGIVLPTGEMFSAHGGGNMAAAAIAKKYPETFSWMCVLDINNMNHIQQRLEQCKTLGAVGVGEYTVNLWIDDPRIQEVLAACERMEMPFLFHLSPEQGYNYGICDTVGLPMLERALQKYPKLIFVGHSQPFWYEISGETVDENDVRNSYPNLPIPKEGRLVQLMRQYPNLYGDLSANSGGNAIMRDEAFGLKFLEEFQDRLLFGTDMVHPDMYFPLADYMEKAVKDGKLSESICQKIFFDNAKSLFNLPV